MKFTIITVCLNNKDTIAHTIESVSSQKAVEKEHIVIDGSSSDGTVDIIKNYEKEISYWISEPDNGMYHALNKGISQANGDIIGILNADDVFDNPLCLYAIKEAFNSQFIKCVFADLVVVDRNITNHVLRYYQSKNFKPSRFAYGFMPAHPTVYFDHKCYLEYGLFKTDYRIAADFELLSRFLYVNGVKYRYLPKIIVRMRKGGRSSKNIISNIIINREIYRACIENNINTNYVKIYSKYFYKIFELFRRPKRKSFSV